MMDRMADLPSWDGGDGGFLNSYFSGPHAVTYVSFVFNADQILLSVPRNRRAWHTDELRLVHYAGPKPWDTLRRRYKRGSDDAGARSQEVQGMSLRLFEELHALWEQEFDRLKVRIPSLVTTYAELLGLEEEAGARARGATAQ